MKRTEVVDKLQGMGAKITGSVSKNTDILVAGDKVLNSLL